MIIQMVAAKTLFRNNVANAQFYGYYFFLKFFGILWCNYKYHYVILYYILNEQDVTTLVYQKKKLKTVISLCEHKSYTDSWKVLLITSSCCSRVSRLKFTAYPETRMVKVGYFSGFSIASIKISRFITFTFKW